MDRQPTEIMEKVLSNMSIDDAAVLTKATNMDLDLLRRRADPVLYLSKTFKYPLSLFAAIADEGCVISGSMAQEFLLPGSIGEDSDWDIYVPGNAKSVTNMLAVLSECGVKWKWLGDDLDDLISSSDGTTKVFCARHLFNIEHWASSTKTDSFDKLQHTKERLREVRAILDSAREVDPGQSYNGYIQVTKARDGYDVQSVDRPALADTDREFDSGSMPSRPAVINGVLTLGQRTEKVQLIVCQIFGNESRPLSLITSFYASHTQCFISGWCAVHLYYDLAKQKKSILWANDADNAVSAAVAKYKARGYRFISPPDPELQYPRERVSTTSKGALMVTFDEVYEQITKYTPTEEIHRYLQCRKAGLERIWWFTDDDKKLVMVVDSELQILRKKRSNILIRADREKQYNRLRLFEHIASHAPSNVRGTLRDYTDMHYDNPIMNKFTQDLMTSGVAAMTSCGFWSFLL